MTGSQSVTQGSIMSGLFYLIFTLDQPMFAHKHQHQNIMDYRQCCTSAEISYVDDIYSIVKSKPGFQLWDTIHEFINVMNTYYTNN